MSAPLVQTSLDRTAIWVGDRVTYTVTIVSPRGFDVLEDDLARDKLKLDGLEIVATDTNRSEDAEGRVTRRFTYVLTSYKVDVPALRIAPASARYYATRAGQRLEDAAPAGEVQIPGAVIAFRSVLPDAQEALALRDGRVAAERPTLFAIAQPVGLGLILVSIVPVAIWGAALVAKARSRYSHRTRRQVLREERASLEAARSIDTATVQGRRDVYTHIDATVRDHLREVSGVSGPSLTPAEVGAALAERRGRVAPETVAALLAECERARYGPPEVVPAPDACRDALAQAEQIVAARR